MRLLIYSCVTMLSIIFLTSQEKNELTNTSWKGLLNAPEPVNAALVFTSDSLFVYIGLDLLESMTYGVKSDTLWVKKVSGVSSCSKETGLYTYTIDDEETLIIKGVSDDCFDRLNAFSPLGYTREK